MNIRIYLRSRNLLLRPRQKKQMMMGGESRKTIKGYTAAYATRAKKKLLGKRNGS